MKLELKFDHSMNFGEAMGLTTERVIEIEDAIQNFLANKPNGAMPSEVVEELTKTMGLNDIEVLYTAFAAGYNAGRSSYVFERQAQAQAFIEAMRSAPVTEQLTPDTTSLPPSKYVN